MEFIFVICILVLPISILHLCNIFFFNKIYKFNYNLYFMSFAIFYGLIGWLFFFISYFQLINFQLINSLFLILFFTSLLIFYRFRYFNLIPKIKNFKTNTKFWLIIFLCTFVVIGDFLECLSPLTNYDTLAYHLTIPTKIIESNLFLIPERALTGFQPLLTHMIFIPLLFFGEEQLLRYFFFTCEILIFIFAYKYFREKLSINLSLLLSLIIITLPVFVYSAGNGNIEIINLIFLLSFFIYFDLKKNKKINDFYQVMPAILIGFYASSKLFGVILFFTYIIFLIINKYKIKQIISYIGIFTFISFQWYLFIFLKTGTPLFPVFYEFLGSKELSFWDIEQNIFFYDQINNDNQSFFLKLITFFVYPFNIFIFPLEKYGGFQLSYGIIFIFSFPILFSYLNEFKLSKIKKMLFRKEYFQIIIIFYVIWYFFGSTLYFRYLTPIIYPLIILHLSWYFGYLIQLKYKKLMFLTLSCVIFFQISLASLHNFNYLKFFIEKETSKEFYKRNVPYYDAINWINNNINTDGVILSDIRAFRYFSKNKILVVQPLLQNKINISTNTDNSKLFFDQLIDQNISHIIRKKNSNLFKKSSYDYHIITLFKKKCLDLVENLIVNDFGSRTINTFKKKENNFEIQLYAVKGGCKV